MIKSSRLKQIGRIDQQKVGVIFSRLYASCSSVIESVQMGNTRNGHTDSLRKKSLQALASLVALNQLLCMP